MVPELPTQLRATDAGREGGGGTTWYGVTLTNVSSSPCELSGYPTSLSGVRANGQSVNLHPAENLTNLGGEASGNIGPGESGSVFLGTNNACFGERTIVPGTFAAARFGLPGGGVLTVAAQMIGPYRFECGASVSPIAVQTPPPTFGPDPLAYLANLTVSLHAPAMVRAGDVLHYTMTLTNPTGGSVVLSPCPSYLERLEWILPRAVGAQYQLNCAPAHPLGPGTRETLALELPIPGAVSGPTTLVLLFMTPPGSSTVLPPSSSPITVVAPTP